MLYTLSSSPYNCDLPALLRTIQLSDILILLSDGVLAGLIGSTALCNLSLTSLKIYALSNDIVARGLTNYFSPNIQIISYTDFVGLTAKQLQQISW